MIQAGRCLEDLAVGDIAWICGVAWQEVRWPVALRADDEVRARWECVGLRPSASLGVPSGKGCRGDGLHPRELRGSQRAIEPSAMPLRISDRRPWSISDFSDLMRALQPRPVV